MFFFVEEIKNGEGKYIFLRWRRKTGKEREEKENIFSQRKRKTKKEKVDHFWRRKLYFCG